MASSCLLHVGEFFITTDALLGTRNSHRPRIPTWPSMELLPLAEVVHFESATECVPPSEGELLDPDVSNKAVEARRRLLSEAIPSATAGVDMGVTVPHYWRL